ncbi:aldehyde oxidase GLOX-like [Andrographis paniculata]|uniref:aldehyde oxidase GLOX-like n=1 Tax=Andrographis paniculata TaxID=175694 RepID=UPI0021E753CC|nr:aldehyde oxidase GLOX-like [Andrographis paniculata]
MTLYQIISLVVPALLLLSRRSSAAAAPAGKWELLQRSIGISAMHMQLLHTDTVVMFDRTGFGTSNISLPAGKCRDDPNEKVTRHDCSAHSVEYDVVSNSVRPLTVLTDTWCSSGAVNSDGTLVQTGGFNDGDHAVRFFPPCRNSSCDWREINPGLTQRRWYATNQILPDGRTIVVGGRRQFNYEFYPKKSAADRSYNFPFLVQTNDPKIENNLYPFVFLNPDGNLFIFANNRAILYDYTKNAVVKTYPEIPGGDPRSYPSTGSAVLLPLKNNSGAEVLVCGGAPKGSFISATKGKFTPALNTCGRIRVDDPNPKWEMEIMPMGRVMGDMTLLPNGDVLIINGAANGTAGWEYGRDPVLSPVLYRPDKPAGSRFEVQSPTAIPRMYHSTAVLLRDGRILVGGSNPHIYYNFTNVLYPTELSLEAFSPAYTTSKIQPKILSPPTQSKLGYNKEFPVRFSIPAAVKVSDIQVKVTLVAPPFTTHSYSMNQRLVMLNGGGGVKAVGNSLYETRVIGPVSGNVAPAGWYMMFVVYEDVPSQGVWVQIGM